MLLELFGIGENPAAEEFDSTDLGNFGTIAIWRNGHKYTLTSINKQPGNGLK